MSQRLVIAVSWGVPWISTDETCHGGSQMPSDIAGLAVASGLGLRPHEEDEFEFEFLTGADTDLESDPDGSDSD